MTRDEAIKELTDLLPEEFLSEYADAIKMGIEALEQEPCEDCISRQAVEDTIINYRWKYSALYKSIKQLPSVTPHQKMRRWVMSDDGLYRPICNNCGAHPWKGYIPTVEEATEAFKYCPNCGAKMQEVEE